MFWRGVLWRDDVLCTFNGCVCPRVFRRSRASSVSTSHRRSSVPTRE